jgi:plastocyanin
MIQIRKSSLTTSVLVILIFTAALTTITTTINSYAQTGTMATLQNIQATYAVSIIPGAAQRDSPYHYYPPALAIPTGTTIAWINNDMGQPHTVTSGSPSASDAGSVFNSGIMPATANSFFQYTLRVAAVSVSDAIERGNNFELSSGTGRTLNLTQDIRTLLDFKPITVPLDRTTPLTILLYYRIILTQSFQEYLLQLVNHYH